MTSTPVMSANSLVSNFVSQTGNTAKGDSNTGSFSKVMDQTTKSDCEVKQQKTPSAQPKEESGNVQKTSQETETSTAKNKVEESETVDVQEMDADAAREYVEEAAEKVVEAIAGVFQISTAEVTEMMNQLQMDSEDLLTVDGLTSLAVALHGGSDQSSLLTDENLYSMVQNLQQTLDSVQQSLQDLLGIDEEQLKALQNQLQSKPQNEVKDFQQLFQQTESIIVNTSADTAVQESETADTFTGFTEKEKINTTTEPEKNTTESTKAEGETITKLAQEDFTKQQFSQESEFSSNSGNQFLQNSQIDLHTETVVSESGPTFEMPTTAEIMDQITEFMKVTMKPEMTQLEMQLHPENLGTLHIQISSREGIMTAQLTTQSEDVKAVLESQMIELRQNLENQGIKVEAVEVTVSEYSLDRSFSGEQQSEGQDNSENKNKSKATRLNLNDLNFDEEELSVEERLTADLMKSNGSTINYTA